MLFYGLDIGSTNTKAVLLDSDGRILDHVSIPSRHQADRSNEAAIWLEHFCQALEYCASKGHLAGQELVCSVTAQGGSFITLDSNFDALRTYHWTENAAGSTVADLINLLGEQSYYHITGWQADAWLAALKLREHLAAGRLPKNSRFLATVPDYLYSQMTRSLVIDITNAQITGMCDFDKAGWHNDILNWISIDRELLPAIERRSAVLFDKVSSPWGKVSFVTGSHDQYAAMRAADLKKDKDVMLGTGTVWVINRRTSEPAFDDKRFLTHPGRDFSEDCFGNIIVIDNIGRGFDQLLIRLGVDKTSLPQMEAAFSKDDLPDKAIAVHLEQGTVSSEFDAQSSIRRYMEWAAAKVAFILDMFSLGTDLDKLVMTGGAAKSRFWPQVIADICDIAVEAVDFPEFTAYGAALFAEQAATGRTHTGQPASGIESKVYEPRSACEYGHWYRNYQYPALQKCFSQGEI